MTTWTSFAQEYDPLAAGSIDKTDTTPHDNAIWRAMNTHYFPPKEDYNPKCVVFVGRLPWSATESQITEKFSRIGKIKKVTLIRDLVTGFSRGYGFVEFCDKYDARKAVHECQGIEFAGRKAIVDFEVSKQMKGWIPRRLGGGWGGRKEGGQMRFGCRNYPWLRPIIPETEESRKPSSDNEGRDKTRRHTDSRHSPEYRRRGHSSRGSDRYKDDSDRKRRSHDQRRHEGSKRKSHHFYESSDKSYRTKDDYRSKNDKHHKRREK